MNIHHATTQAELSHNEVERIAHEVTTRLSKSQWTAELVDTLVAEVASAVVERLGKNGVDLADVACYRVAAVVNERLVKTLTSAAVGASFRVGVSDEGTLGEQVERLATFILNEVQDEPSQRAGACDTAIRVIRNQRQQIAEKDRRIQDAHDEMYRAQQHITDLQNLFAKRSYDDDDNITNKAIISVARRRILRAENLVLLLLENVAEPLRADVRTLHSRLMEIMEIMGRDAP